MVGSTDDALLGLGPCIWNLSLSVLIVSMIPYLALAWLSIGMPFSMEY